MSVPTIYRSGDTSAPVLTGTAGDLVNLLDKCLVDGYGSKAGAGWTKAFTATNQRSYRQGGGNQFYLDVDDRGASGVLTGASGKEAAIRGYEVMTAVSTGTNLFPTTAQVSANQANWRKSATADSMPRGWLIVADNNGFYICILDNDVANQYKIYGFGDFYSLKISDGFRTYVSIRLSANTTSSGSGIFNQFYQADFMSGASIAGFYSARRADSSGTSVNIGFISTGINWSTANAVSLLDNIIYISKLLANDSTNLFRGWFRGIYQVAISGPLNDGDIILGTGDLAGRSFLVVKGIQGLGNTSYAAIETTQWDTSS